MYFHKADCSLAGAALHMTCDAQLGASWKFDAEIDALLKAHRLNACAFRLADACLIMFVF